MGNIFKLDSPFMKFLTLITNLVCLNVLWLLCCLPVVTAGAATVAMYYVIFLYITKQDDTVAKPFFKAFKQRYQEIRLHWIFHNSEKKLSKKAISRCSIATMVISIH